MGRAGFRPWPTISMYLSCAVPASGRRLSGQGFRPFSTAPSPSWPRGGSGTNFGRRAYPALLQDLYSVNQRYGGVKQELRNIERLNEALGFPSRRLKVVHVAGTNGKGSVSWKIAQALRASQLKTGLFTSPHISCYRERMQVDGQFIHESEMEELMLEVFGVAERHGIRATFFEYTTAMALAYFAKQQVDIVVLEAGLGGRLDSTNVIQSPLLTVITSVGLEHTRILGSTVEAIAAEKAGIAKPGRPMLVGPNVPLEVVSRVCEPLGCDVHVSDCRGEVRQVNFDEENTLIASEAIKLLGIPDRPEVQAALESRPPCRFELVTAFGQQYILDAGHNAPAIGRLMGTVRSKLHDLVKTQPVSLQSDRSRLTCAVVLALSSDKDAQATIDNLRRNADVVSEVIFTRANTSRAQDPTILEEAWRASQVPVHHPVRIGVADSVEEALELTRLRDLEVPNSENPVATIVCGTVFMMTEARQWLGLEPQVDPFGLLHKPPARP